jgi:Fic family protein
MEQLYKAWLSFQPLKPEDQERLDFKFKLDFNYNSNHLEGNTLTYGQTKLLLMFDQTSGNASLRDYEEMNAHNVGLEMMKLQALDKERPLSESFIRELNKTILVKDFRKEAVTNEGNSICMEIKVGTYKTRPNSVLTITGEMFHYASVEETPAFMTDLVTWYNTEEAKGELSPVELAALFHYRYIRIHPFEDGNGRIARLIVNYILLRHNYPMIVVESEDRRNYLSVLHQCDGNAGVTPSDGANAAINQIQPLTDYLKERLKHALTIGIKAAKGESIEEENDFEKRIVLLQRQVKKRFLFSSEQVWNVLEYFYFPFVKKILEALKPAQVFFSELNTKNALMTNGKMVCIEKHIKRNTANKQIKDYISNAETLHFDYVMQKPNSDYCMMGNLSIKITFSVAFKDDHYTVSCLSDRKFKYGTCPIEEEITNTVLSYKTQVLTQIESAINGQTSDN